jgi:hypothetical protein
VLVLHTYELSLQYSCGIVLVFWFWWEIVFGVTYILSVQFSCVVVSFWLWWEIVLKMEHLLISYEQFLRKNSYWVGYFIMIH